MNRVALVGAGCGRGALTLRGAQLLSACACVVYDSLLDASVMERIPAHCVKYDVGKRAGGHSASQEDIHALLLACSRQYPLTVRLKGGDPFVFGRGGEELAFLTAAGVPCEVVPGVTSAVAAAERFGIPVTHRGVSRAFTVMTAHTDAGIPDFASCAKAQGTLVFLMAKAAAGKIADDLIKGGMSAETPACVVSAAGMSGETMHRCTLSRLADTAALLPAPMTVIVGMVCAEGLLGPYMPPPRVVVTGTAAHVSGVCRALEAYGLDPVPCVHRRIVPRSLGAFFARLDCFDRLVFTSGNGVEVFWEQARQAGIDVRRLAGKRIAAIGGATAARLAEHGILADLVPAQYTAHALAQALRADGADRARTALLRAAEGSKELLSVGTQIDVYDTVDCEEGILCAERALSQAACVTFSSAGGARALLARVALPAEIKVVCIGEETASAVRAAGYCPAVAERPAADSLARAVREVLCSD